MWDGGYGGYGGWAGHYGMGYGFGWIFMVLFWILLIVGIVAIIKWAFSSGHGPTHVLPPSPQRTAHDILKERYARGEIDKDEFEERRRTLGE